MDEIKNAISDYHNETKALIKPLQEQVASLDNKLESSLTEISQKMEGGGIAPQTRVEAPEPGRFFASVAGRRVPVLRNSERLSGYFADSRETFNLADFVRGNMGMDVKNVVSSGSATVPVSIGSEVIDAVRAASRVVEAGAGTIFIPEPTNLARIDGDPTVHEHTEAADDVADSDVTLSAVSLNPKTLVAAIPLSMEVVEDSPNLQDVLLTSLGAAFGAKLDALALATILADSNVAVADTDSPGPDVATWAGILNVAGQCLADDQEIPQSLICNTADFIARASQLASTSGSWLGAPPILAKMKDLFTTKLDAGEIVIGDFYRSVIIAARSELRFELVRWNQYTKGSHVLVAHARVGAVVAQPGQLMKISL